MHTLWPRNSILSIIQHNKRTKCIIIDDTLFMMAKNWKFTQILINRRMIEKRFYIHAVEYCSAMWINTFRLLAITLMTHKHNIKQKNQDTKEVSQYYSIYIRFFQRTKLIYSVKVKIVFPTEGLVMGGRKKVDM